MRVLITGASGFIGSYITAAFLRDGHDVVCAVRDVGRTNAKFPLAEVIHCDFNYDITADSWLKRLDKIDVVVNVVGLLNSVGSNKLDNVHIHGPKALFDACVKAKVKRVVHISALGIDEEKTTEYSKTKKVTEDYLKSLSGIDWVILQPSLVYANGAFGGTSLLRSLAAVPYLTFLMGDGSQQFQPLHISNLTDTVLFCAQKEGEIKKLLKVVGPKVMTVKEILANFRRWMGLKPAICVSVPLVFIRIMCIIGDFIGRGPLNNTSYKMMNCLNVAKKEEFVEFTGIEPKSMELAISSDPLTQQSMWHARLFLLKPYLKVILGLFWIATGVITGILDPEAGKHMIRDCGFGESYVEPMLYATCGTDIVLGLWLICARSIVYPAMLQIMMIVGYTITLSFLQPILWLDPFGSLTKNIPIIFFIIVLLAIEGDR